MTEFFCNDNICRKLRHGKNVGKFSKHEAPFNTPSGFHSVKIFTPIFLAWKFSLYLSRHASMQVQFTHRDREKISWFLVKSISPLFAWRVTNENLRETLRLDTVENDRKSLENSMFVNVFLEMENCRLMKCFPCVTVNKYSRKMSHKLRVHWSGKYR